MSSSATRTTPAAGQPDLDPVVAVVAPARGLPALAHAAREARRDEPQRRAVVEVAAAGDRAAVLERGEVDRCRVPRRVTGSGDRLAVDAQPGDAAVGVDRPAGRGSTGARTRPRRCWPRRPSAAPARPASSTPPRAARRPTACRRRSTASTAASTGKLPVKWLVSTTTARTTPGMPEPHDRLVARVRRPVAAAPGLPAVVDLALGAERLRREGGRPGRDEVLAAGEELVVGPHHAAAVGPQRQVGQRRRGEPGLVHHASPLDSSRPRAGRSAVTGDPANHVARTTPVRRAPS